MGEIWGKWGRDPGHTAVKTVVWSTLETSVVCYVRTAAVGIIPVKFKLCRKDETRQIIQKKTGGRCIKTFISQGHNKKESAFNSFNIHTEATLMNVLGRCALTSSLGWAGRPRRGGPLLCEYTSGLEGLSSWADYHFLCLNRADCLLNLLIFIWGRSASVGLCGLFCLTELCHLHGQGQLGFQLQLSDVLHGQTVPLVLPTPGLPVGTNHHFSQTWEAIIETKFFDLQF